MKKIILVRHGKAEEQGYEISDFQRSLTSKGKSIATAVAEKLKEKEKDPGLFISSPAFRALETALVFAGIFGVAPEEVVLDSNLYYRMDMKYLKKLLASLDEKTDSIILFGHNPSFTHIASELAKGSVDFIPKTGVACITFKNAAWKDIAEGAGRLEYFLVPEKIL